MKASNRYTLEHFDQDLRTVMWRVGVQGEQVCFIFDESNVLSPAFLERFGVLSYFIALRVRSLFVCAPP